MRYIRFLYGTLKDVILSQDSQILFRVRVKPFKKARVVNEYFSCINYSQNGCDKTQAYRASNPFHTIARNLNVGSRKRRSCRKTVGGSRKPANHMHSCRSKRLHYSIKLEQASEVSFARDIVGFDFSIRRLIPVPSLDSLCMPLTSRANTHPTASRLTDFGMPFLPSLLRKSQPTAGNESPPMKVSTPPRSKSSRGREKTFFTNKQKHVRRTKKLDEAPLLGDQDEDTMNLSRPLAHLLSLGSCKRVSDLDLVPEVRREYDANLFEMPKDMDHSPHKSKTRISCRSYATTVTASSSGSTSSGDLMTISPPTSPRNANHRVIISPTNFRVSYEDEEVKVVEVDTSMETFLSNYDSDELMSTSASGTQGKEDDNDSTSSNSSTSSFLANPTESFIKLVEDCEARWSTYTESLREWTSVPALLPASADVPGSSEKVVVKLRGNKSSSLILADSHPNTIESRMLRSSSAKQQQLSTLALKESQLIQAQQKEIEHLRAQLLQQQEQLVREEAAFSTYRPATWEQIDSIPLEEIEVTIDSNEELSINSGLTNLNDASTRFNNDDATVMMSRIPPTRPDAASVAENDAIVQTKFARNLPLKLQAANGHVRSALYTGPTTGGVLTGVGTLRFETGDHYMGEVVNGKASGQGRVIFRYCYPCSHFCLLRRCTDTEPTHLPRRREGKRC